MEPNLELYHCNDEERCKKYLLDTNYMIDSIEDGIWLGNGMYFWDNISNAKYWLRKKVGKDSTKVYCIVRSQVLLSKLLDLTDEERCKAMERLWQTYITVTKRKCNVEMGKKLNILFDYYHDSFDKEYDVIKVYGCYKRKSKGNFICYNPSNKFPQPTIQTKCIYSVRNTRSIITRKIVDNI